MRLAPSLLSGQTLLGLLVMFGLMVAGLFAPSPVSGAGAEGPATSVSGSMGPGLEIDGGPVHFLGFVFPDSEGALATKVRAIGPGGVVCGTADVVLSGDVLGFYQISVTPSTVRRGCPSSGDLVEFVLLYGQVGVESPATPSQVPVFSATQTRVVSLSPVDAGAGGWSGGALPSEGGTSLLVWSGPGVPVEDAVALLGPQVASVSRYDGATGEFLTYVPGAPSFTQSYRWVSTGDVALVRSR